MAAPLCDRRSVPSVTAVRPLPHLAIKQPVYVQRTLLRHSAIGVVGAMFL